MRLVGLRVRAGRAGASAHRARAGGRLPRPRRRQRRAQPRRAHDVARAQPSARSCCTRRARSSTTARHEEIAAVACGFGVLARRRRGGLGEVVRRAAHGAGHGAARSRRSPWRSRSSSRCTARSVSDARAHLGRDAARGLDLAVAWVESNPLLVEALRDRPATARDRASSSWSPCAGFSVGGFTSARSTREMRAPARPAVRAHLRRQASPARGSARARGRGARRRVTR